MAYVIFDLDGTVIDSSHRHLAKPNGDVDMEHWFENAIPAKIAADGLLPLANAMRRIYEAGHTVIVCTSRCLTDADRQFLTDNQLPFHVMLSRPGRRVERDDPAFEGSYHGFIGDGRADAILKAEQLENYFRGEGFACAADAKAIMFDDNLSVLGKMKEIGIGAFDATAINAQMAANARMRRLAA